jgi:DNA-binding transcriptional LysR family regulator
MSKRPAKRPGVNLVSITQALAVAERSSFRGAARMLGIPQSVVSRHVRNLEDALGVRLFVRHQAGARMTTAGAEFLETAREFMSQFENSRSHARAAARGAIGRILSGSYLRSPMGS